MSLSARNQLSGKVIDIKFGAIIALISVQVGDNVIQSVITQLSAETLQLKTGDSVRVVIKSTDVMLDKD
jgi:molybdopterin-binding protein